MAGERVGAWDVISNQFPKWWKDTANAQFERDAPQGVMSSMLRKPQRETVRDVTPMNVMEAGFDVAAPLAFYAGDVEAAPGAKALKGTGKGVGALSKALRGGDVVSKPQGFSITPSTPRELSAAAQGKPFPNIYRDPRELVANAKVAPEDPIMQQLFGVTRKDLYDISEQGTRKGNITERPFAAAAKPKGAAHLENVMRPENEQRLIDIITEARNRPELFQGMASWYTMDPLFKKFVEIHGPEKAVEEYKRFNALMGMSSPNSEVLTEINRGTGANMLHKAGRFEDFMNYAGIPGHGRGADFPQDMRAIQGHMVHKTAQAGPMSKYLRGDTDPLTMGMGSPKVPSYIHASGVPETGFQTQWPVGDAHWSRLVGLPEHRGLVKDPRTGGQVPNAASASGPEMTQLGPWWKEQVAGKTGLESVPAQAVVWGAGSNATGVTSPIGAPKLELLAQQIRKASERLGISPEQARDEIIAGRQHAGFIDPRLAGGIGIAAGAGTGGYYAKKKVEALRDARDAKMKKALGETDETNKENSNE